ncbi:hypothetical protein EXIGLDRAFT_770881 [Exidia glandulosa HHB12029]|uniref:Uncharacterized protein n=1 Tax=Exidia glandulosa HHB12029 TaxID=1314781 RepID=A0A165GE22_EXIGL|nr:hypothetical protein EXIGLDRAFT_770881 [Exidia glandulosa HHB12029]
MQLPGQFTGAGSRLLQWVPDDQVERSQRPVAHVVRSIVARNVDLSGQTIVVLSVFAGVIGGSIVLFVLIKWCFWCITKMRMTEEKAIPGIAALPPPRSPRSSPEELQPLHKVFEKGTAGDTPSTGLAPEPKSNTDAATSSGQGDIGRMRSLVRDVIGHLDQASPAPPPYRSNTTGTNIPTRIVLQARDDGQNTDVGSVPPYTLE